MPYLILSIDGGGLRGIVPVLILKKISKMLRNKHPVEIFDLFTGTSTGGLIVCALTLEGENKGRPKFSLDQIEELYAKEGDNIFPRKYWLYRAIRDLKSWFFNEYHEEGINKVLTHYFEDKTLSSCLKPIIIPAYDIKNHAPVFFKNLYTFPIANTYNYRKNYKLSDVCRATSAGPTFFSSHIIKGNDIETVNCIDGGIYINNPAMEALIEIQKNKMHPHYNRPTLKDDEIFVLSIGTGHFSPNGHDIKVKKGKLGWARPLIEMMMASNSQLAEGQVKNSFDAITKKNSVNYLRLTIPIDEKYSKMDDSSSFTRDYLERQVNLIINKPEVMIRIKHFLEAAKVMVEDKIV